MSSLRSKQGKGCWMLRKYTHTSVGLEVWLKWQSDRLASTRSSVQTLVPKKPKKNQLHFYTLVMNNRKRELRNYNSTKGIKSIGIKITKEV
jgi:hypothetical protein